MITQVIADSSSQAQADKIWNQPTAKAQVGDYIRVPCAPVMRVVDRDVLSSGQVRLLVKPTTASGTEEWILSPELEELPALQPTPQPTPQKQPSGFSGDSVACLMKSSFKQCQRRSPELASQAKAPEPQTTPQQKTEWKQGYKETRHYGQALSPRSLAASRNIFHTRLDGGVVELLMRYSLIRKIVEPVWFITSMIFQVLHCPYCQGVDLVKNGKSPQGKQRFLCRESFCNGRTFILDYAYPGQSRQVKEQIVDMAMNGSGIRDTARVLHVSTSTVIKELKKKSICSNKSTC